MAGCNTRANAHEWQQILFNVEEKIFVQWITRLTCAGFLASLMLVVQMAEEVYCKHIHFRNDMNVFNQFI